MTSNIEQFHATWDIEEATKLLDEGIDVNVKHDGRTKLIHAMKRNDEGMVKLLSDRGASFDIEDIYSTAVTDYLGGRYRQCPHLGSLAMYGLLDIKEVVKFFECAVIKHCYIIAEKMLQEGFTIEDSNGRAFSYAIGHNDNEMFDWLLHRGFDINKKYNYDFLVYAIAYNANALRRLVDLGLKINFKEKGLLLLAVRNLNLESLKFLIEQGANVLEMDNMGITPLKAATKIRNARKRAQIVDYVRSQMKPLTANLDTNRLNYLFYAVRNGKYKLVKRLVDQGADVRGMDENGTTALKIANSLKWDRNTQQICNYLWCRLGFSTREV